MNDQPKPTTGECTCDESASDVIIDQYCPQHGSLKPASGEWIGGNCKFCNEPDGKHKADCYRDAINAAVAAESQKWQRVWTDRYETLAQATQQLRSQLAAEREHVAALQRLEATLQDQLAAEREKVQTLTDAIKSHNDWVLNNDDVQMKCYLIALSDHP